jgi:hypothetical protein
LDRYTIPVNASPEVEATVEQDPEAAVNGIETPGATPAVIVTVPGVMVSVHVWPPKVRDTEFAIVLDVPVLSASRELPAPGVVAL